MDQDARTARLAIVAARQTTETQGTTGRARLWMAIARGEVPRRSEDVDGWYAAARHCLGLCLHEAHLERVLTEGTAEERLAAEDRQAA